TTPLRRSKGSAKLWRASPASRRRIKNAKLEAVTEVEQSLPELAPANSRDADSPAEPEQMQRRLESRQLSMIAIGGAIGVGLFLGSSFTIQLAGPGVIITYLLGAFITIVIAYAIAEMAVVHPVAGSFGVYAEKYLNPWAGFTVRATYGL